MKINALAGSEPLRNCWQAPKGICTGRAAFICKYLPWTVDSTFFIALFVLKNIMLGVSKKIEISQSQTYNICFMFGTIFFFIRNICDALISLIIRRDSKCQWDNLHLLNICQSTKMFSIVMPTLVTCRQSKKSTKGHHHGWHCSYWSSLNY